MHQATPPAPAPAPKAQEAERIFKIVLAGDAAVGKSSFIMRLCKNKFVSNLNSTLGESPSEYFIIRCDIFYDQFDIYRINIIVACALRSARYLENASMVFSSQHNLQALFGIAA